jgi:hypothetical protein
MNVRKVAQITYNISSANKDTIFFKWRHEPSLMGAKRSMGKAEKLESLPGHRDTSPKHVSKPFVDSLLRRPWIVKHRQPILVCEKYAHEVLSVGFVFSQNTI